MYPLSHINEDLKSCIEICGSCRDICLNMATTHCLELGGKHVEPGHLRLMLDCVDICATAVNFMLRNSPRHKLTCGVCAEVCKACADDCERIGNMETCAEACRRCAEHCRKMAA